MAAGDQYLTCENNFITDHALLQSMLYEDSNGNPAILISNSTGKTPWINCQERSNLSIEQLLKLIIVQDEAGNPAFNVT